MDLSLSSFVYGKSTIENAIKRVSKLGFSSVDLSSNRPHAFPDDYPGAERSNLIRILKKNDMKVSAITSSGGSPHWHFTHPNLLVRESTVRYIKSCIDLASDLNSPTVEVTSGRPVIEDISDKQASEWLKKALEECADYASSRQITIGLEPEPNNFVSTTGQAMLLIDGISSNSLKFLLDVGHLYIAREDIPKSVELMKGRIAHVHIHDNDSYKDQHLLPGLGKIDFTAFINSLKKVGYNSYLSIEIMQVSNENEIIRAREYVQSLI
jgi:sugar phosphate isomerase/epimerase